MPDTQHLIGHILDEGYDQRDAIHIAVLPAVAGAILMPGRKVWLRDGVAFNYVDDVTGEPLGIVDPFLRTSVQYGQRFFIFLLPNTITSLRHVWTHPSIPDATLRPVEATTLPNDPAARALVLGVAAEAAHMLGVEVSPEMMVRLQEMARQERARLRAEGYTASAVHMDGSVHLGTPSVPLREDRPRGGVNAPPPSRTPLQEYVEGLQGLQRDRGSFPMPQNPSFAELADNIWISPESMINRTLPAGLVESQIARGRAIQNEIIRQASETWLRNFCDTREFNIPYEVLMAAIMEDPLPYREGNPRVSIDFGCVLIGEDIEGDRAIPDEFWRHVAVVLGVEPRHRPSSFACSC